MKYVTLIVFILLGVNLVGQTSSPTGPVAGDSVVVKDTSETKEEMPRFPGNEAAFQQYLMNNLHYPDSALKYGRQGTAFVYFEVSKDGSIGNVYCKRGIPGAPDLDAEAVRVIAAMPNWIPGKINGRPVKVSMTVPVKFVLE